MDQAGGVFALWERRGSPQPLLLNDANGGVGPPTLIKQGPAINGTIGAAQIAAQGASRR